MTTDLEFLQTLTEDELTELVVIPLLAQMGYSDIRYTHGAREFGRDLVFVKEEPLEGKRHFAATIKRHKLSGGVSDARSINEGNQGQSPVPVIPVVIPVT